FRSDACTLTPESYRALTAFRPGVAHLAGEPRRDSSCDRGNRETPRDAPKWRRSRDVERRAERGSAEDDVRDSTGGFFRHTVRDGDWDLVCWSRPLTSSYSRLVLPGVLYGLPVV